jgi:hypothetical protein
MAWFRILAVLAATLTLAACYETASEVPAISDARRLAESPITPGIWCSADVAFDNADAMTSVKLQDCFTARFEAGMLTVEQLHGDASGRKEEPIDFAVAALNRGATLLQTRTEADRHYEIYVAKTREDGVAVLPELKLTPAIIADALALGVTIKRDANASREAEKRELRILSGEPDAVRQLIAHAVGLRFDQGVRDRVLWKELMNESIFFLRLEADPKQVPPDPAALAAQLERLRSAIRHAMTLE